MAVNVIEIKLETLKTSSIAINDPLNFFLIDGSLKIFNSRTRSALSYAKINDHEKILEAFSTVKKLTGVCHQIEKNYDKNQIVHIVLSTEELDIRGIAEERIKQREQKEKIQLEERMRIEKEAEMKRLEEMKKKEQMMAELKRIQQENKLKAAQIKAANRDYIQKVISGQINPNENNSNLLDSLLGMFFTKKEYIRSTHCFDCKKSLTSNRDIKCTRCSWLLCNCGACGCTYQLFSS